MSLLALAMTDTCFKDARTAMNKRLESLARSIHNVTVQLETARRYNPEDYEDLLSGKHTLVDDHKDLQRAIDCIFYSEFNGHPELEMLGYTLVTLKKYPELSTIVPQVTAEYVKRFTQLANKLKQNRDEYVQAQHRLLSDMLGGISATTSVKETLTDEGRQEVLLIVSSLTRPDDVISALSHTVLLHAQPRTRVL